jgi:hypothetical protein
MPFEFPIAVLASTTLLLHGVVVTAPQTPMPKSTAEPVA